MNNNFDFDRWHLSLFNASHFEMLATRSDMSEFDLTGAAN